jgi:cyclic pyranopterin phosphate synthase
LHDLRISVIDRCNFRCPYCMPREVFGPDHVFLPPSEVLTDDELVRLARAFIRGGVRKLRITGGEPLLRAGLPALLGRLSALPNAADSSLTTNGWQLASFARELAAGGLRRVNVSLDALDDALFGRMNGRGFGAKRVLEGIDAALAAGLGVKINMVVQRGVNESEIVPMARYFRERGITLRFIEFMDVGNCNGWRMDQVVPAGEIVRLIGADHALEPLEPNYRGEVAARYRYVGTETEIGLISSVTEPFCRDCHRARLSADGRIFTCLFAATGTDLRGPLRNGADDEALYALLSRVWGGRVDRYSEERAELLAAGAHPQKVEMSYIGG